MSEIAGRSLFNSGPHRFITKPLGSLYRPPLVEDSLQVYTLVYDRLEVFLVQTGRLVADTTGELWGFVETIRNHAEKLLNGQLTDNNGRIWDNMTLLRFVPEDRIDRGRKVSLAYRVDYGRLLG